ncbi:MAG: cohesin domain-containing protein, partial [Bacillota bacterium]|nr:cohesin domain-containing protein [Bacillota bacterium]
MRSTKIIALLVIGLLIANVMGLASFASPSTASTVKVYGDVDLDNNFDSDDYALFRQYLLGMIKQDQLTMAADVDGNGKFDSDDYAYMRQLLIGMISVFPVQITPTNTVTPLPSATPTYTSTPTPTVNTNTPASDNNFYMSADKTNAASGELIKVTFYINNINSFSGYQANLIYDPKALKPVYSYGTDYATDSAPETGSLLINRFSPMDFAKNDLEQGILNFGRAYLALSSYKNSGSAEASGSIAVLYFKVLNPVTTSISLRNSDTMPQGINGTIITDWDGNQVTGYTVNQTLAINQVKETTLPSQPVSTPTSNTDTPAITPSISSTPSVTSPVGYVSLSTDKSNAQAGDIITASLKVDGIANLGGIQANIKYDPLCLQPVLPNGTSYTPYDSFTAPSKVDLFNKDFSPMELASNDISNGTLNFGFTYNNLSAYRSAGIPETTGAVAQIKFLVLQDSPTKIQLAASETMPNSKGGVYLFNWDADILSNYEVKSSVVDINSLPTPSDASNITLAYSKNMVEAGDILNVSIAANNLDNISGYQAQLKYNPEILEPVYYDSQTSTYIKYDIITTPEKGNLLSGNFTPFEFATNNLITGTLNFGRCYLNLQAYINSNSP